MNNLNQDRPLPLSRLLLLVTVHRRLRSEILSGVLAGDFAKIGKKAVLYFSLLKADYLLRRGMREIADDLYDHEFGSLPSLERRIYECIVKIDAYQRWVDEHEKSGQGLENFIF